MIYKIPFIFLSLFFLMATLLMGSQCITQAPQTPGGQGSHFPQIDPTVPLNPDGCNPSIEYCDLTDDPGSNDPPPENDGRALCHREEFKKIASQVNARAAYFDPVVSNVTDYFAGQRLDFDPKCSRIFLTMSKTNSGTYSGNLYTVFQLNSLGPDGKPQFKGKELTSGHTPDHNQYNEWVGLKFYAIFEHKNRNSPVPDGAVILHLTDVRPSVIGDGEHVSLGAGQLYYKMFRGTVNPDDVCFSEGTHMRYRIQSGNPPAKRNICWLFPTGPWSCRPQGVLKPRAPLTKIDITRNLTCYNNLGTFFGLIIQDTFNVGDLSEL